MHMIVFAAQAVPEGRVFGLDAQTLIQIGIQLFNAILLAAALTYILYNPVKDFLRKRTERIKKSMDDANATMAKANELVAEYDTRLKNINNERTKILEAARLQAADESKVILEEARREASEIKKRSMESILEEKKRLHKETRLHIIEVASLMAQKYVAQSMDDATQDKLFEEALAELEDAQWQN